MTVKVKLPPPAPQEFIDDCAILAVDFEKIGHKIERIVTKWEQKGFDKKTIGGWLRPLLKQHYSPNWVTKLLPVEARQKQNKKPKNEEKVTENVTIEEDEVAEIYQMPPDEYKLEDLEKYDRPYLYSVIEWLDKANERIAKEALELAKENEILKTQIKALKKESLKVVAK